jgi:hypothetical protein
MPKVWFAEEGFGKLFMLVFLCGAPKETTRLLHTLKEKVMAAARVLTQKR